MRRTMKYVMTTAAAAAMLAGTVCVGNAAESSCPTCGQLLSGSTVSVNTPSVSNGWVSKAVGNETVYYYYKNGQMVKSDWVQSPASGLWYYFDEDGIMLSDSWGCDSKSEDYYFSPNGDMATGWRQISLEDDEDHYGPGSETDEKGYFYFGSDGKVKEGWVNIGGTYYFMNDGYVDGFADYQMVYGEVEIDGEEYYFGEANDGSMKKGMVKVVTESNSNSPSSSNKESYYLYRDNGTRAVGDWCKYNGQWYYVNDDGEIVTESFLAFTSKGAETEVDSSDAKEIYYMDKNGIMKKGWLELGTDKEIRPGVIQGKTYYYFKDNGIMALGWIKDGSKYYYLNPDEKSTKWAKGQMVTGLCEIGGDTYYLGSNGAMAASCFEEIENNTGEHTIYLDSEGVMIKGSSDKDLAIKKIGTKWYFFDENGYRLEKGDVVIETSTTYEKYTGKIEDLASGTKYWEITSNSGVAKQYTSPKK